MNMVFMFFNCDSMSMVNYDFIFIGWASLFMIFQDIILGVDGLSYCEFKDIRQMLIEQYNWIFFGDSDGCFFIFDGMFMVIKIDICGISQLIIGNSSDVSIECIFFDCEYNSVLVYVGVDWENDGEVDEFFYFFLSSFFDGFFVYEYEMFGVYEIVLYVDVFVQFYIEDCKYELLSVEQWGSFFLSIVEVMFKDVKYFFLVDEGNVFVLDSVGSME